MINDKETNIKFQGVTRGCGMSFRNKLEMINKPINYSNLTQLGIIGTPSKVKIFKENEFKRELAPTNAKVENYEVEGDKIIIMSYSY